MGSFVVMKKDAFVNSRLAYFFGMMHEAVHLVSYEAYHLYQGRIPVASYRQGYTVTDYRKRPRHEHLRGFDEGMTDSVAGEIMGKHWDELIGIFGFTQAEVDRYETLYRIGETGYAADREMVLGMLPTIAQNRNEPYADTWQRYKRGMFTGKMMHLRDVDRVFGRGQLQAIAYY